MLCCAALPSTCSGDLCGPACWSNRASLDGVCYPSSNSTLSHGSAGSQQLLFASRFLLTIMRVLFRYNAAEELNIILAGSNTTPCTKIMVFWHCLFVACQPPISWRSIAVDAPLKPAVLTNMRMVWLSTLTFLGMHNSSLSMECWEHH